MASLDFAQTRPYGPAAFRTARRPAQGLRAERKGAMSKDAPDPRKLDELGERLAKARRRREAPAGQGGGSSLGAAWKISTELVVAVFVGAAIGWLLDRWFATSPFLLIVFFFLGAGAGFLNVIRSAREMDEKAGDAGKKGK